MFGPTSRLLRSTGAFLGFAVAVSGCQSVTQQKASWSFPPFREEIEERPVIAVDRQALPPLPPEYAHSAMATNQPSSASIATAAETKPLTAGSPVQRPLQDASIVRASSILPLPSETKTPPGFETGAVSAAATPPIGIAEVPIDRTGSGFSKPIYTVSERNAGKSASSAISGPSGPVASPIEPPPSLPIPMDPKSTQQIVKRIVGASDDLIRTSAEPNAEDEDPIMPALAGPIANPGQIEPKALPVTASNRPTRAEVAAERSRPVRPPLETIPAEAAEIARSRTTAASEKAPISIPRAAICKSVEGRGRFSAMPEQSRVPGAPIIIYWEMDDLARGKTGQGVVFTALVELVSSDRDEILASARETVRESGPEPAEGDFAALRWRIPPELVPGDYRIRISVTEASTKSTATTQIDLPVGRGPVASRFLLP